MTIPKYMDFRRKNAFALFFSLQAEIKLHFLFSVLIWDCVTELKFPNVLCSKNEI